MAAVTRGYRRYIEADPTYPSSNRVVCVPLAMPTNRRMALIRLHGSTMKGDSLFGGRSTGGVQPDWRFIQASDALIHALDLVVIHPDLGYLDAASSTRASCGMTSGIVRVTTPNCVANDIGKKVSGTGVPANATVAAVVPGVSFNLSAPATASGTQTLTIGPDPNNTDSWMNPNAMAQLAAYFGVGGLLDSLGCRTDKAYFMGESQGGTAVAMFAANYPSRIGGITCYASSFDLEFARTAQVQTQGSSDINLAFGRPATEVGQIDMDGAATGHPTTIDPVTGITTPARVYGTSLKFSGSQPLAGQFAHPLDPRQMDILRDQIPRSSVPMHLYESTYDTVAGPNVMSAVPNPSDPTHTTYLRGGGRIWAAYVGASVYTFSAVDDHPGSSIGDPVHEGFNQFIDLPITRMADEILAVA